MSQPAPLVVGALSIPVSHNAVPGCRIGPYLNGSDRWILTSERPTTLTANLVAYQSTDGGVHYTKIVAGPDCAVFDDEVQSTIAYIYPVGGSILSVAYQAPDLSLNVIDFDMSSGGGSFGAVSPTGISVPLGEAGIGLTRLSYGVQPSGDRVVTYSRYALPLMAVARVGGVWNAPVQIDDGSALNFFHENTVVLGTGNIGVLYSRGSDPSSRAGQKLFAIFNGTTVLSRQSTPLVASADSGTFCAPAYSSVSDSACFPLVRNVLVGFNLLPAISLLVVTNSAAPVFTVVTIKQFGFADLAGTGDVLDFANVTVDVSGTRWNAFWYRQNQALQRLVEQSSAASRTGPWSAPVLYYNENLAPPTPAPSFVGLAPVFANSLSNDSIGVIVGLVQIISTVVYRGVLYTWAPSTPPPPIPPGPPGPNPPAPGQTALQLNVVMTGGFSPPSAATTSAIGPVTLSGAGGVANTAVPSGSYTIAGTAVLGYTGPVLTKIGSGTFVGSTLTLANGQTAVVTATYTSTAPGGSLTYTIIDGALPPGMTLNPSTGLISGTPTATGVYTYTWIATDGVNTTAPVTCAINVFNCPDII